MRRKVISEPVGDNPETAGLYIRVNEEHPMKGDVALVNFWSNNEEVVYVDSNEIDDLIKALKEVKQQ